MSLYDHVSALEQVTNRALGVKSQLDSCLDGLLGSLPKDSPDSAGRPVRSGVNGELQDRIEGLLQIVGQLETLASMLGDQCIDNRKGRGEFASMSTQAPPIPSRIGY